MRWPPHRSHHEASLLSLDQLLAPQSYFGACGYLFVSVRQRPPHFIMPGGDDTMSNAPTAVPTLPPDVMQKGTQGKGRRKGKHKPAVPVIAPTAHASAAARHTVMGHCALTGERFSEVNIMRGVCKQVDCSQCLPTLFLDMLATRFPATWHRVSLSERSEPQCVIVPATLWHALVACVASTLVVAGMIVCGKSLLIVTSLSRATHDPCSVSHV